MDRALVTVEAPGAVGLSAAHLGSTLMSECHGGMASWLVPVGLRGHNRLQ